MEKILKNELTLSKEIKTKITASLAVFLAISVFFCVFLYNSTKTTVRDQAVRSLTNICQLNQDAITRAFQNRENLMKTIATRITNRGVYDVEGILHELEDFDKSYGCCSMGVLDADRTVYRTDGVVDPEPDEEIASLIWEKEPKISKSYSPSYGDGYMVNLFSYPITQNGEIKCVLFATYYSKDLTERMNINSLRGRGFTFLLDKQGQVVILSKQYKDEKYQELMKYINETPEIIPEESGDGHFDYRGECYYARFEAMHVNDWYMMTCGREVDVFAEARFITRSAFVALGVMWLFILTAAVVAFHSISRSQERIRQNHFYDGLLGIYNQNALEVCFRKIPRESLSQMYLVVFDVDKFKEFNYIYGNESGDRLLRYIVQVFREEVTDVYLFRQRSDYFITLDEGRDDEEIVRKIQKTLDRFAQDIANGVIQPFDTSAGIRKIDPDVSLRQLISDAIIARDGIKGDHLRHYAFYDQLIRKRRLDYMEMESGFTKALQKKEFHVYYQPKYNMDTGEIIGAEALARWIKPDGTIISPGEFIPCFEASRQISQLDEAILTEVCRQMKEMQENGLDVKPVSVNLSRVHLQQPDILQRLLEIIEDSGADPRNLSFEITESAWLEENIPLREIACQLRSLGCRVDMDDYGVGASGPMALASNCFDAVKLDKSFVDEIGDGHVDAVIETTIHLAKKLGLEVLAEGVEEKHQADRLTQLGCFWAQGFYYSEPLPEEEYRELLVRSAGQLGGDAGEKGRSGKEIYYPCFSEDFCIALDTTEIPIYIIDPATFEIIYCNQNLQQYIGRNPLGEICHKAIRGFDAVCPDCAVMRILKEGVNEAAEYRLPNGTCVLVKVSFLNWRGRKLYKVTWADITKQKNLEEELRLYNKEYSAVVYQSTSGVMRYDMATGEAAVNVDINLNRVEEYTIPDYVNVVRDSGIIEQESLPEAKSMLRDIYSGVQSKGYDLHLVLKDGQERWCHLDYTLIENEEGKPFRAVVSFFDNTEKQEKELAYHRWHTRLNALMNEYTAYMEVNLSKDVIEAEGRHGAWEKSSDGRCFSDALEKMASAGVFEEDRFNFRKFFHRERLLGQFLAGHTDGSLEYRTMLEGEFQWYKAEIQMVSDPISGDVKASVMISNVDLDMREKEQLRSEAERDTMTRLYNRGVAETLIRQVMELSTGERCCFLIIDLDDLREINSYLGHPEGDRALMAIADCMRSQFRKSDIMGRIGGDEFVVLLRNAPEIEGLRSSLAMFRERLSKIKIGPLNDWPVHASVGGTMGTAGVDDFDTMYRQADLALFYTKAMGKNAFHMYVPEMENRDFSYRSRAAASLTSADSFSGDEMKRLLQAVSIYCPMIISINLTQNTYCVMEYVDYTTQIQKEEGQYDYLVKSGVETFHPEDRAAFLKALGRESLMEAYRQGRRMVYHIGRQVGNDGMYHRAKTITVFMEDEQTKDVCAISFTHVIQPEE